MLPKSDPWTCSSGIKSSVMPSNERQSQLLITVDPITGMRRKFVKGYEMVKFLNSCHIEVQFVGETIIFASHLQGRCDELPVLHHIDARWKTQLRAPKSKVNSTLRWIYKLESMHDEPRRYSIARLQQLSFRSNMNRDLKAYPFTSNTSGYRKVKIDNQTRMSALLRPARLPSQLLPTAVPLDLMTGRPDYGGCYYSTMIIVVNLSELIIIISTHSTCDTTNERTNHLCKAHNANYQSLLDALWSKETCPTVPTSEDLDFLRCYEQCPLSVDGATWLQRRARSEQAHVSRLRPTQLRAPGPLIVEVRIVDDCYVGIWLNGMEGCEVRWYFKESTSCSAKHEVNSLERGQHAALENLIDFIIGSNVLSSYWSINNYDSPVKSQGNLNLPNSTTSLNSIENSSDLSPKVTSKEDKTVSDSSHYEQSCPKGVYLDPDKKSCARLQHRMYVSTQIKTTETRRVVPLPRMETFPLLDGLPCPALVDDDHSVNKKTDGLAKSATSNPAALTLGPGPATPGLTGNPGATIIESVPNCFELLTVSNVRGTPVEEFSLCREDSNDESSNDPDDTCPLKFISSYLMPQEAPAKLKEFVPIRTVIVAKVNGLQLVMKRVFRVSSERNQGFWFGMKSIRRQTWRMKSYTLHRKENE